MTSRRCAVAGLLLAACGARSGLDLPVARADASRVVSDARSPADAFDSRARDAGQETGPPMVLEAGVTCADGGFPVAYVLDLNGLLYTFDPATLSTTLVGAPACGDAAGAWDFTVSREGNAYIIYDDWKIFEVDLHSPSLPCTPTAFVNGQLGLTGNFTSTVLPTSTGEQMLFYGTPAGGASPILARSDLTTFVLSEIGPVDVPSQFGATILDVKADALGRLFGLSEDGMFDQINPASGELISALNTPFASANWALLTFEDQLYFFGGQNVSGFDLATRALTVLGTVGPTVVGASAVPCLHAP